MDKSSDLYRLSWALAMVLDGIPSHDLHNETGLPKAECDLIHQIRIDAQIIVEDMNWDTPE